MLQTLLTESIAVSSSVETLWFFIKKSYKPLLKNSNYPFNHIVAMDAS